MPYKQGDTATGPNGEIVVFDGENWQDQSPSTIKDVARSGLAGLGHGVAQLAGLPFSMADLAARGLGKLAENTVGEGMLTKGFENIRRDVAPIIGSKLEEYGEKAIPAMAYEPQTGWGQAAHTAGEWAPAVLGGGAGALARGGLKAGAQALTKGTTSALGSEALGQATHEAFPDWEPAARMIGALAGYRLPATAGKAAEWVTAPSAARVKDVTEKLAAYDKKYKPNQAKPNEYWELKKEQASHPAYTALPPGAAEAPGWAEKIAGPAGYALGGLAAHTFFPVGSAGELATVLGAGQLASNLGPKMLGKMTGAATKGTVGALGQELKQDPYTPAWLTGARAVPALDRSFQEGE